MVSFWCSGMSGLDAPDIIVTDVTLLSYCKYTQMFLSPSINTAKI